MRPSQMGRLRAEDFRLDKPIPYVAVPRGKGGRIAAVPLVPAGAAAARAFLDAEAFGPWPRSSVNRALARAGRPAFTTYQIRHSFAAGLRRAGTDVADIQDLYGHTRPETTMIYAPPEVARHRAALERLRRTDRNGAPDPAGRPVLAAADGLAQQGTKLNAVTSRRSPARTPCPRAAGGIAYWRRVYLDRREPERVRQTQTAAGLETGRTPLRRSHGRMRETDRDRRAADARPHRPHVAVLEGRDGSTRRV